MPIYEYECQKCRKKFSVEMPIGEYGKKQTKCPSCNSTSVERCYSGFFAQTSKKS